MSIRALNWAMASRTGSPSRKAVLVVLADKADDQHSCFPSVATIAYETELSERSVRDQLAQLRTAGFITTQQRFNSRGTQTSTRYFLLVGQEPTASNALAKSVDGAEIDTRQNLPGTDSSVDNFAEVPAQRGDIRDLDTLQNLPPTLQASQGEGAALAGGGCESCTPTTLNPKVNLQENPQSSSESTAVVDNPNSRSNSDIDDDSNSAIAPGLANFLRELHPRLDAESLIRRLSRTIRVDALDLSRAAAEIITAAPRVLGDPVAYVASSIEKEPDRWPRVIMTNHQIADIRSARARCLVPYDWPEDEPLAPDVLRALAAARQKDLASL